MTDTRALWHCFDFDGVLAHPYTMPELLFPGVAPLLRRLKERGDRIVVASFNPRSYHALRELHEDEHLLDDMRCGSNDCTWWADNGVYSDALHRHQLSKAAMIRAMGAPVSASDPDVVRFYDDDPDNIKDVREQLPQVACYWVDDWSKGVVPFLDSWFRH
jgi:hypothetical protein